MTTAVATKPESPVATFAYVDLASLIIDPRYQRAVSRAKVKEIAANFNERAAGLLTISERPDGTQVILDGQHRRDSMLKIDKTQWLAEVYLNLTLQEEAEVFIAKNSVRKNPEAIDVFRARLTAGDPKALRIRRIVEEFGLHIIVHNAGSHKRFPKGIYAVRALEDIINTRGEETLQTVLFTAVQAWPDEYLALEEKVLLGLARFCTVYAGQFDQQDLIRKLAMTPIKTMVVRAQGNADVTGGPPCATSLAPSPKPTTRASGPTASTWTKSSRLPFLSFLLQLRAQPGCCAPP
ncbi:MAG: hypothetical protein H0X24_11840 [Ktedonobacterales bacterium]|nr:hypothetical protein [Ktedonobacterales bacterium]